MDHAPADNGVAPRWPARDQWSAELGAALEIAIDFLSTINDKPVARHVTPAELAPRFDEPLPEIGSPPQEILRDWIERAEPGIVRSAGPRYFGFVTGGSTPAALAGDWLASMVDQNAFSWLSSPAAAQTELTAIRWLLDLFHLPSEWSGVITTGATMANLVGLASARQWASHHLGFDAAGDGLGGHPAISVVSSTEIHQSALKALAVLGLGRANITLVPAPGGAVDLDAFDQVLAGIQSPVIVVGNAGEVNSGAFDNLQGLGERCASHAPGAWLHVDGAFGLYAALSDRHRSYLDGIELADSVATDAHKWLNVPYDCGVAFMKDARWSHGAFAGSGAYLQRDAYGTAWNAFEHLPEFSRRMRALSVWCALRGAGRSGFQEIVERAIANAATFAAWVEQQPELELMATAHLNIVCFRVRPSGRSADPDADNATAIAAIQNSGLAFVTGTRWHGRGAIRAAFDNWATGPADVEALQDAVRLAVASLQAVDSAAL
ncbi:MAG: pyridoxal-dependent decarboxylase [Thermomicrobiales bacterium]